MQWDAEDAAARTKYRDRTLRSYAARELGRFTPHYREAFRAAKVDAASVRGMGDLAKVRPVTWDDVADDPAAFVVTPSQQDLMAAGERRTVLAVAAGRLLRRLDVANRKVVEPQFKPVAWVPVDGVPVGYTDSDLTQLADLGARALGVAGLDRTDLLVTLTGPADGVAHWQLTLGARHGGLAATHLGPTADPADVVAASPTVLAGPADRLATVLEAGGDFEGLHTVMVAGEDPGPPVRSRLRALATAAGAEAPVIVALWAPVGARGLWVECPDGAGYHTYPDVEVVEVARGGAVHARGEGQLIWSALGWRGTVVFRLLTGRRAELQDVTCDGCGRRGPVVTTGSRQAADAVEVLEDRPEISSFFVELGARNGTDEVVVHLALRRGTDLQALLSDVDPGIGATQYVVAAKRTVDAKVKAAGGRVTGA